MGRANFVRVDRNSREIRANFAASNEGLARLIRYLWRLLGTITAVTVSRFATGADSSQVFSLRFSIDVRYPTVPIVDVGTLPIPANVCVRNAGAND
jgi:hypothetical protein